MEVVGSQPQKFVGADPRRMVVVVDGRWRSISRLFGDPWEKAGLNAYVTSAQKAKEQ